MTPLQRALGANAIFSTLSGLSLLFVPGQIASFLGLAQAVSLPGIGLGLLLFAFFVGWVASRPSRRLVQFSIVQDLLWVIASVGVIFFSLFQLHANGYLILAIVAALVGLFAYLQFRHLEWAV